jgi:hypothetical protein
MTVKIISWLFTCKTLKLTLQTVAFSYDLYDTAQATQVNAGRKLGCFALE